MNDILKKTKYFFDTYHKKIFTIGSITLGALVAVTLAALFIYNSTPHYAYPPLGACDLFPTEKAHAMLGEKVIGNVTEPTVSGDTAISKCSYSDTNEDESSMRVLALAIKSGLNDKGIASIKKDFASVRPAANTETVSGIGDSAYFNKESGQLEVLNGRVWLIVSYVVGDAPVTTDIQQQVSVAKDAITRIPKK